MKTHIQRFISQFLLIILFLTITFTEILYNADMLLCDNLYKKLESQSRDIRIIAIDEKTEAAYGKFESWSREKAAELTALLYADASAAPAVLAFDVLFVGESDARVDANLASVCEKAGSVIVASNLVYQGVVREDEEHQKYFDASHIERVEEPYESLAQVTENGFANVSLSEDNIIRFAQLFAEKDGKRLESFAYTIYKAYSEKLGNPIDEPRTQGGHTGFFYSGNPGDIPHASLSDVLEGKVPVSEFTDCLVLVGAYAPAFQDSHNPAIARGEQMYGVEINANIVLALMNGKLANPVPKVLYAAIAAAVLALWLILKEKQGLLAVFAEAAALIGFHLLLGRILALNGYLIPQAGFIGIIVLTIILFIIQKYVLEQLQHRRTLQTLKKYVAPQIVDKLSREGGFELHLGGEKKHIAVLFVDVRGFTTMSEALPPEKVVNILNQYLSVTTQAVFANEGTLDKFIGDAAMAVFNAPFDLEDYVYKAVKTAWDIREGVAALAESYEAEYHRSVNVGIGVNCGEAVVGNIGCDFRMDYTAIGDTVNTAARLESSAPAGKILISQAVYDAVADRISVEPMGELTLKGKTEKISVYSVTGIRRQG